MNTLLSIPRAVRGPATVNFPSTAVPAGFSLFRLTVNRFAWPDGPGVATMHVEVSQDNGVTWPDIASATLDGGAIPFRGNIDPPSRVTIQLPNPENTQRRIRATVVLKAPLDCSVVVEAA